MKFYINGTLLCTFSKPHASIYATGGIGIYADNFWPNNPLDVDWVKFTPTPPPAAAAASLASR